jgi:pimeloyl-ACP methyl ester carboxylesterase
MSVPRPAIVLIHGLGLKVGEEQELGTWRDALGRGLAEDPNFAAADLYMAYYSAELHPEVNVVSSAATRSGTRHRRGAETTLHPSAVAAAEEQVVNVLEQRFWQYAAQQQAEQSPAGEPPAEAASGAPRRRGATSRRGVTMLPDVQISPGQPYRAFVRDIFKYFGLGHREPVNAKLATLLASLEPDRPVLLIAHSLGTVVSYDVLSTGSHSVDTWITLGSPLGYTQNLQGQLRGWLKDLSPEDAVALAGVGGRVEETVAWVSETVEGARTGIQDFFSRFRRRGTARRDVYFLPVPEFPDGKVDRWYNIYDPTDPVAAPPGVGDPKLTDKYLSGGMQRVYDVAIRNPGNHPHSEVGYLETLQTTWLVKDFLSRHAAH